MKDSNGKLIFQRPLVFRMWNGKKFVDEYGKFVGDIVISFDTICNAFMFKSNNSATHHIIQQRTEFQDIDNNYIFEGDILSCINREKTKNVEVTFSQGSFKFENRLIPEFLEFNKVKVIGNIFENINLLK